MSRARLINASQLAFDLAPASLPVLALGKQSTCVYAKITKTPPADGLKDGRIPPLLLRASHWSLSSPCAATDVLQRTGAFSSW